MSGVCAAGVVVCMSETIITIRSQTIFIFIFFPSWSIYLSLNAKQPSEENPKFRSLRISTRNNRRGPNLYSHKEHASSSPSCGEKADDRSEVQKGGVGGGHSDLQVGLAG